MKLDDITLPPLGTCKRTDCPECGGFNTLSISNKRGKLYYHCFRACCSCSGIQNTELSIWDAKESSALVKYVPPFKIRFQSFVPVSTLDKGYDYLVKNNCLAQYEKEPHRFFYDIRLDRIVFVEYTVEGVEVLVTGRSLIGEKPKWYKYVADGHPVYTATTSENANVAFIVEDCASACSVGRIGVGVALCGTSWNTTTLAQTLQRLGIEEVSISLDEDAQSKSLRLKFELEGRFKKVRLLTFSDDAKYLTLQQLKGEYDAKQEKSST